MFTKATKNFGVWREERKSNQISFHLSSIQFVVSLSIMAFIVFLTFIIVVKIRQEFFLIESAPIDLFKNHNLNSTFFIPERSAALSVFVKRKDAENFQIYFEEGESFLWPKEEELFNKYLDKRRKSIVYMAMLMRINSEKNSRVKVLTEREVQFDDIQAIMKIFSQFGFDSFDFGVER